MCRLTIRQRFDVEVVTTSFQMPLWEALALVRSTDLFLGMHGAGFANLLGMHKVSRPGRRPNLAVRLVVLSLGMASATGTPFDQERTEADLLSVIGQEPLAPTGSDLSCLACSVALLVVHDNGKDLS